MKRKGGKDAVKRPAELQNKQERGEKRQRQPLAIDHLINPDPSQNEKEKGTRTQLNGPLSSRMRIKRKKRQEEQQHNDSMTMHQIPYG